jgi:hypothetical protein
VPAFAATGIENDPIPKITRSEGRNPAKEFLSIGIGQL